MRDTTQLDDAVLLERWRAGDREAGQQLFRRYYDEIQRFFMNKITTGVSDLVQETFTACVAGRDRVRDSRKFRSYLYSIAYNLLRNRYGQKSRTGELLDLDEVTSADLSPGPSTVLVQREEQRLLLEALRRIPVTDQVVLELHYWEQMSMRDIAEVLGCPRDTIKSRVRRAQERLQRAMARLARSQALLKSTRTRLEDWATQIRVEIRRTTATHVDTSTDDA